LRSTGRTTTRRSLGQQSRLRASGCPILFELRLYLTDLLVSLQVLEKFDLGLYRVRGEVAVAVDEVGIVEWLGAVLGFHGVDEVGLFVVAEVFECGDVEGGHHVVVFVDQVVAVEHVETIPSGEARLVESMREALCELTGHSEQELAPFRSYSAIRHPSMRSARKEGLREYHQYGQQPGSR
jgi:hypothetical protein